jgi:hypothetical protein
VSQGIDQLDRYIPYCSSRLIAASIGLSLITPVPAQAATAQELGNLFDFLKKYVVDLDKLTNPAPSPDTTPAETESIVPEPNSDEWNWNN